MNDTRFRDGVGAGETMLTRTAQGDTGSFAPDRDDERYQRFELAGAVSRWSVELPHDTNGFDPKIWDRHYH